MSRIFENVGASISRNLKRLQGLYRDINKQQNSL
jgi:hypothetical protein